MMMVFKKLLEIQVESAQKLSRSFRLPFLKEYHISEDQVSNWTLKTILNGKIHIGINYFSGTSRFHNSHNCVPA